MDNPRISIVAAIGQNRELGRGNDLLWRIPDDLKRFKTLTSGHPVIMGRKTWDSLPEKFRPLPNRTNIVVSRQAVEAPGAVVVNSIEQALEYARSADTEEVFVIGGAQIYQAALPHADRLYLTLVDASADADVYFPEYETMFTKKVAETRGEHEGLKYTWVDLER